MNDLLSLDPANRRDETIEPTKTKRIAHAVRLAQTIEISRWFGKSLQRRRYPLTARNLKRYRLINDLLDEYEPLPF